MGWIPYGIPMAFPRNHCPVDPTYDLWGDPNSHMRDKNELPHSLRRQNQKKLLPEIPPVIYCGRFACRENGSIDKRWRPGGAQRHGRNIAHATSDTLTALKRGRDRMRRHPHKRAHTRAENSRTHTSKNKQRRVDVAFCGTHPPLHRNSKLPTAPKFFN